MARYRFVPRAAAVSQIDQLAVGGTVEVGDEFHIRCGNITLGKQITVVAESTVLADVADQIVEEWDALDADLYPEFRELTPEATSGGALTVTGPEGWPFTLTVSTTESGGGAADLQTFVKTNLQSATGPDWWSEASNWDQGAVPGNGDDVDIEMLETPIRFGLDQNGVTLASLNILNSFQGSNAQLGLPYLNEESSPYPEYRDTHLKIQSVLCNIGRGEGSGSERIHLNLVTSASEVHIHNTGSRSNELHATVQILLGHASSVLNLYGGDVELSPMLGDSSSLASINLYGGTLRCGRGVTPPILLMYGGQGTFEQNPQSITKKGGVLLLRGSGNVSVLDNLVGDLFAQITGNITTRLTCGPGARCSVDGVSDAIDIAHLILHTGAVFVDRPGRSVIAIGPDYINCTLADATFLWGTNVRLAATSL